MNYSNMIEEKNLKKTFIIATLISTIIGTFTTGINLYDRVGDKRKQHKTDSGQDAKITALEKRVNDAQLERKQMSRRNKELRESLSSSGPMIRKEYDQQFSRLGPRFAEGDLLAQTQLQGQIITLQGTVIKLLEDSLMTGRQPDINKLYNASEFARDGAIRALRDQYQRLLQSAPPERPMAPVRRISSQPQLRIEAPPAQFEGPKRSGTMVLFNNPGPLFCRYAEMLQDTRRPLDASFLEDNGPCDCPACGVVLAVEPGRAWKIDKELVRERVTKADEQVVETFEDRTYALSNRFLVKCHRTGAGFACVLCYRHRDRDTLCESMETLVNHVWKKHDIGEYESDPDIQDVTVTYRR